VLRSYWWCQHDRFYPDSVASSGHHFWVHQQFEISVFVGPTTLVKTNENHCGLSQGCKKGGSCFLSPLLPMLPSSNLLCVDGRCQAVGHSSFTDSQVFLPDTWCTSLQSKLP
jgi:hypothetical protein